MPDKEITNRTAFMFPGQGAQSVGMGKELYANLPRARDIYSEANEILGYDLKEICFNGPGKVLAQTKYSQPAILVTSMAYLQQKEQEPQAVAGLSLGEYTALICAGALKFSSGLELVQQRALLMEEASSQCAGGMASIIGLGEEEVRRIIRENGDKVDIANLNCPGQVVISGLKEDIDGIIPMVKAAGARKVIPLKVSGPFHSRYMDPARVQLEPFIREAEIKEPRISFYANVTGTRISNPEEIKDCLIRQVSSTTYWEKGICNMIADGAESFQEVGPGNVLAGLLRRIRK